MGIGKTYIEISKFPLSRQIILMVLPISFLIISLIMRHNAGPFWLWSNLDPDYWYLFDALNIINGDWPKHIAHPGTTVQWISAIIIKTLHPLSTAENINVKVLTSPERYLVIIGHFFVILNTIALILAGLISYQVFRDLVPSLLIQLGPFLSKLVFKWTLHVSPEPLLVTVVIALAITTILALREGELEKHGNRYAIVFATIAGFGLISKVTSAGIYLMPVVLLWNYKKIAVYCFFTLIAMMLFSLPAIGVYEVIIDRFTAISTASGFHGEGAQTFIDFDNYPRNLVRVSSRPVFFLVFFFALILIFLLHEQCKRNHQPFPIIGRAVGGLSLAFFAQALLVAKHPAGHYMLPALTASGFGFALIFQTMKELLKNSDRGLIRLRYFFTLALIVITGAQINSLFKLNNQFKQRSTSSAAIDETPFKNCARIYFWPASHPMYALFMGSWNTNYSFANQLKSIYPEQKIMFYTSDGTLHGFGNKYNLKNLKNKFSCIYVRGERPDNSLEVLQNSLVTLAPKGRCQDGDEAVFTWGIDCSK